MGLALADMVAQLQSDVPQRGNVPSAAQYEACVEQAIANYGKRRPMLRRTEIDIQSGVAEYALPDDFWQLVYLDGWDATGGVINTSTGLVAIPDSYREDWEILGRTLVLHPTPTYTWDDRVLKYLAVHVQSGDEGAEQYAYLTLDDQEVFWSLAQALALQVIANTMAGNATDYTLHDVRENRTNPLAEVRKQIDDLKATYEDAVTRSNKAAPTLGHGYTRAELEAWL